MYLKRVLKKSLAVILVFCASGIISGCNKNNNLDSKNNDKKYEIYELAVESGLTDLTYEEWLVTIKGAKGDKGDDGHTPSITIGNNGNWFIDNVDTSVKAKGEGGVAGSDGTVWYTGTVAPNNSNGKNGDFYIDTLLQTIYCKENDVWVNKVVLSDGVDGKQIELNATESYIQWRYVGDDTWNNLLPLSAIKGDLGKQIELQVANEHIQWRYEGGAWSNLISLDSLKVKGEDGTTWMTGSGTPTINAKSGDFYFDTENDDIYIYSNNGWKLEIDLVTKEKNKDLVLETGVYTGFMHGFNFFANIETNNEVIVTNLLLNDRPASEFGVYDPEIEINGDIITITVTVRNGQDQVGNKMSSDMVLGENNILLPYVNDMEYDLLQGVYENADNEESERVLRLSNSSFALIYDGLFVKGKWHVSHVDNESGEYGLTLIAEDNKVFNIYVNYFYRTMELVAVGDIEGHFFDFNGQTFVCSYIDGRYIVRIGNSNPVEVVNIYGFDVVNYFHIETANGIYLLDYLTGKVYFVTKQYSDFYGTSYFTSSGDYLYYNFDGEKMVMYGEDVSKTIEGYNVLVFAEDGRITIRKTENNITNVMFDGYLMNFKYIEDNVYTAFNDGIFVTITLDFDGSIKTIITEEAVSVYDEDSFRDAMNGNITTLVLENNIEFSTTINVVSELKINLNGYNIASPSDTKGDGIFHVLEGGLLTIGGNGVVDSVGNNDYSMAVWADGGDVVINGGTFTNVGAGGHSHYDLIYVKNGGTVTINDGRFICQTPAWTLNSNNTEKGIIFVNGGEFFEFNPSEANTDDNGSENNPVNYMANNNFEVYVDSRAEGDWYIVLFENNN